MGENEQLGVLMVAVWHVACAADAEIEATMLLATVHMETWMRRRQQQG